MAESVIIVGAGIAGLSAGCYAQMNGYRTTILEQHNIPGGLCTSWMRKGYTWDISMHILVGSKSGPAHQMWNELGALRNCRSVYHDAFVRVESSDRRVDYCLHARRKCSHIGKKSPESV